MWASDALVELICLIYIHYRRFQIAVEVGWSDHPILPDRVPESPTDVASIVNDGE